MVTELEEVSVTRAGLCWDLKARRLQAAGCLWVEMVGWGWCSPNSGDGRMGGLLS